MSELALSVRGLSRAYGKHRAVSDLDLSVQPGDVYGFLGPNGAGKTTAIRCILRLIRADRGTVSIFGEPHTPTSLAEVGAIVETPAFHGWMSGRANLVVSCAYAGLGGKKANAEIDRVLERVGLKERGKDKARTYSLGMKQRLGIARALLGGPRLLVLDEPTNGLDPRGMREVRDLVRSLALHDQITVLMSSHLLAEVQAVCNRVGIIQEGTLRAEGEVEALIAQTSTETIVEVGCAEPAALKAAIETFEHVQILGPGEQGRLRLKVDEHLSVAELNRRLVGADIAVEALVPRSRDLEDVFLEVTR